MEPSGFWKLFAETGEPVYWLLCRAETPPQAERTAAPEMPPQREEHPAPH